MADEKANKRRSMLMPRGTLANASISRIASPTKQARPTSMFTLDSSQARELAGIPTPGEMAYTSRPRADTSSTTTSTGSTTMSGLKRPMTRVNEEQGNTAGSGIARSGSLRKPTVGKPTHSKTQSISKQMPTVQEKRSSIVTRSMAVKPAAEEKPVSGLPGRSKLPSSGIARAPSVKHSRTSSSVSNGQSALPSAAGIPKLGSRPTSMMLPPPSKPAFSTLQQHYSPLKARGPKPASSTLINPPAPEVQPSVSLETSFQQTHLLQLSLLHASFHPTFSDWCTSTRHAMRRKFADVSARAQITQEKEREYRTAHNVHALSIWGGGPDGTLAENIQTIATVIQDLEVLCDERTGRVISIVEGFQGWLDAVQELWQLRSQAEARGDPEGAVEVVDGLGNAWRQEASLLARRLGGLKSMIDTLEKPQDGSTVADVVQMVTELIETGLHELETILGIEKMIVAGERQWVDNQLERMLATMDMS